jgi:hypothetical protein
MWLHRAQSRKQAMTLQENLMINTETNPPVTCTPLENELNMPFPTLNGIMAERYFVAQIRGCSI